MGPAAEVGLALDIDHVGGPQIGFGGDPRGAAEGNFADLVDRQAVDLTDRGTAHVDQDTAVGVSLVDLFLVEVVAKAVLAEGFDHLGVRDHLDPLAARPVIGLLQHADHLPEAQRKSAFVGR